MNAQKFHDLIKRYEEGTTSPAETILIERWLESRSALDPVSDFDEVQLETIRVRMEENISTRINKSTSPFKVWRIAATLLLIAVSGFLTYKYITDVPSEVEGRIDFIAGSDRATLELADGTTVPLNGTASAIPDQGASQVQSEAGRISYVATQKSVLSRAEAHNIIKTPRGGQYQLALADGSTVALDAASSLRFPTAFLGNERVVELSGQAYFEIAKNANMPFKVLLPNGTQVEVLGTHFNVMAYEEETAIRTTLLEGSVRVSLSGVEGVLLSPNQRASISKDRKITVENVNVNQAVAWKNNKFVFKNTGIEEIMRQLSRWYDVDVVYEGDVKSLTFIGTISRKENASAVLNLLELTGTVKFKMEGRKITVMKTKPS